MKPDVHIFPLLILWHGDFGGIRRCPAELFTLIVKAGGKKPEVIVLKMEPSTALVDAALAQDDSLHALAEGFANKGPFFESDGGVLFQMLCVTWYAFGKAVIADRLQTEHRKLNTENLNLFSICR